MRRFAYLCFAFVACLLVLRPTQVMAQTPGFTCPCQNEVDDHWGWWCQVSGACFSFWPWEDDDFYRRKHHKHWCDPVMCIQCDSWEWEECCFEPDPEPDCDWYW